jgi:glycosyltransferase involved in cell wall biosynthesis
VRRCAITLALSMRDATRLRALAGRDALVRHVAVPIETVLPPADTPLDGDPPIVLLGSVGWTPNRDAVSWFVGECWPAVRAGVPTARLHVIGERPASPLPEGATASPPIADSRAAFPNRAIFVVAARVTTGVRVKILEAWARGVPVVSTSAGASGLGAEPGGNLLIADDPPAFARAIGLLRDETLRATLVAGGRARLAADHDPQRIARQVEAAYEDAIARHAGLRSAELSASTRRA